MDYEQKYKESLERAKEQLNGAKVFDYDNEQIAHDIRTTVYNIFPQLKESEDEKIRKELISYFKQFANEELRGVNISDWIAWLEKQGKHANFRNKIQIGDHVTRNDNGELVNLSQLKRVAVKENKGNYGGISPNSAWSEEDEKIFRALSEALARISSNTRTDSTSINYSFFAEIDWLRSLKERVQPQNRWKPSDVQIDAVKWYIDGNNQNGEARSDLRTLYNDLKKLNDMGETNNKTEREFWTKHSAEIAIEMSRKMQAISDILSNNALSADSGTYVKLRNLEPNVKELFYILTTI